MVLVYHDGVKDDSELMKDMRDNYIPSIASECDGQEIELMTFRTKCKSRYLFSYLTKLNNQVRTNF